MMIVVNGADKLDQRMEVVLAAEPAINWCVVQCNVLYRNSIGIHCIVLIASKPLHLK
jgi:hypothetical protein